MFADLLIDKLFDGSNFTFFTNIVKVEPLVMMSFPISSWRLKTVLKYKKKILLAYCLHAVHIHTYINSHNTVHHNKCLNQICAGSKLLKLPSKQSKASIENLFKLQYEHFVFPFTVNMYNTLGIRHYIK